MARKKSNVIGLRRHHLTIIDELPNKVMPAGHSRRVVVARCDCGSIKHYFLNNFSASTKTCGECSYAKSMRKVAASGVAKERHSLGRNKEKKTRTKPQEWCVVGSLAFLDVFGGRAYVDADDVPLVSNYRWTTARSASHGIYLRAKHMNSSISIHRLIAGFPASLEVDHIDGNPLNNTRKNLRACSRSENARNRKIAKHNKSGLKGVYLDKRRNTWVAQLTFNGKKMRKTGFTSQIEAAKFYDEAAKTHFGKFARLNF